MPYHVMLTDDIWGFFGSAKDRMAIIDSLKDGGISARSYDVRTGQELPRDLTRFDQFGLKVVPRPVAAGGGSKVTFDSKYAFLFGTDKQSREQIFADLMEYFGNRGSDVDEIALQTPAPNEWLACATLVNPPPPAEPTYQIVALVGASQVATQIPWPQEKQPPQLWTPHAEPGPKMIRDIKAFTGGGRWF
jgi:hypothetical protein